MKSLPSPPSSSVVAVAAEDGVVAGAAVDGDLDQRREVAGRRERVVAAIHVDDEVLGRADVDRERRRDRARSKRTRVPFAVSGEDLGAVAAVDLGGVVAGAAFEQVGVVARVPDHAVVAGLRRTPGRRRRRRSACRCSAPPNRKSKPPLPSRVSLPLWPNSMSPPEPPVIVSLPAPPNRLAARQRAVRLVERDGVVAALAEHLDQRRVGDRRRAALDGDGAAVDEDRAGRVAADRDGVVEVVAERRQELRVGLKVAVTAIVFPLESVACC